MQVVDLLLDRLECRYILEVTAVSDAITRQAKRIDPVACLSQNRGQAKGQVETFIRDKQYALLHGTHPQIMAYGRRIEEIHAVNAEVSSARHRRSCSTWNNTRNAIAADSEVA